ncbi:MAG: carbohydrate ABC transporter permease [Planctomycetes bacterium]|nr:carbohydrate ABC transporter permease [Planctomycetota bacterium]NOG54856.1 carbohydrate ABC transporter permease [Planctomycetota bacterium]
MRKSARQHASAWQRPGIPARLLVHGLIYLTGLTMLLPFAWMVSTALKTHDQAISLEPTLLPTGWPTAWHWENFARAWQTADLGAFYVNSTIVAVVVTVLSTVHNALAGFAFAKLRFAGRRTLFVALLATMMLPYQVYFIFAYVLCGWLGYVDNYQALIVPFLASAFGIFYMRQAVSSIPDDLLDAGRIDGFSDFELFLHIVVPAVRPAVAALAIFTFMASWNNFFWPLIVIDSNDLYTLPLGVAALSSKYYDAPWPVQMAAATIITLPMLVVFLVFQRAFVQGITLTGVKG